jgi:hypothetical protein
MDQLLQANLMIFLLKKKSLVAGMVLASCFPATGTFNIHSICGEQRK